MEVLRLTQLNDYNTCPKKYYWAWQEMLEPRDRSAVRALDIGALMHDCLHLWYKHWQCDASDRLKLCTLLLETQPEEIADEVARLLVDYVKTYPKEDFEILAVEQSLGVEILPNIFVAGTPDLLISYAGKHTYVFETKTAARNDQRVLRQYLKSPQVVDYTWMTKEVYNLSWVGVLINMVIKTNTPQYVRQPAIISSHMIDRWKDYALRTTVEILNSKEYDYWPENLTKCHEFWGDCVFDSLCSSPTQTTARDLYQQRELKFPIREDFVVKYLDGRIERR